MNTNVRMHLGIFLCWLGWHDWRYASNYRRPGEISRARCQRCEARKWEANR